MGGKKGAEFPGTGATGSDENKDEETAAKQIQDAWNGDGTMWQSKSEPEATEAIKATGKKKTKEKTAKKDELAPPGAVCSSEKQDKQVVGKLVLGAHQHKKKNDKGKKNAELAASQIQYAWRKRVEVNLEKQEELPTSKAIGCNKTQDEQVVGKPVPGAHQHKKKNDKGKKGVEFPGTGATGSDKNKDEETAAKQIQDAWNGDGTM